MPSGAINDDRRRSEFITLRAISNAPETTQVQLHNHMSDL